MLSGEKEFEKWGFICGIYLHIFIYDMSVLIAGKGF